MRPGSGQRRVVALAAAALTLAACSSGDDAAAPPIPPLQAPDGVEDAASPSGAGGTELTFHCGLDDGCPEVLVEGDPHATTDGSPSPFRGYGDPSLEAAADGTIWLAYSWLETLVRDPGSTPVVDFGVRTHLARSDDRGATFRFVTRINEHERAVHPSSGAEGYLQREVPSLVQESDGAWRLWHLDYFDPIGEGPFNRSDYFFSEATAEAPPALADRSRPVLAGLFTAEELGGARTVADVPGLERCATGTEPGLFSHAGTTWLALHCLVLDGTDRRPEQEEIALLRFESDGSLAYVGALLTAGDAEALDVDVHTQPDLFLGRDGSVLLLVTPKVLGGQPEHRGCVVYAIGDLAGAAVTRDAAGIPLQRARITADGTGLGPGLCSYDAASETGVLLVITDFDLTLDPPRLRFSLRRTGIHP